MDAWPPVIATVGEMLERAARSPHAITLIDRDLREERLRYEDLLVLASRGARGLERRGAVPGGRICLISQTSMDLLVALFSVWAAGAIPIVMPLPRRRNDLHDYLADLRQRMATVSPAVVLVSDELLDIGVQFGRSSFVVVSLSELKGEAGDGRRRRNLAGEDEIGLIQFTSGTTRSSRAVTLTHRQIIANLAALQAALQIDPGTDILVSWLPLYHDMGLIGALLVPLFSGIPLVLEPSRDFLARPRSWLDAMSAYRGTITASPSFGYALAARDVTANPGELDLSCVRCACNGSEPVDIDTVNSFFSATEPYGFRPAAMLPMYGLAECVLAVTASAPGTSPEGKWISHEALETEGQARPARPGERQKGVMSCGWPLPGTAVTVRDPAGGQVPARHVGEVCVRSPSVMAGYWQDAAATADVLVDGWIHTGDLGFWDDDGLVVCGRAKDVIIIGGRNLYPEDYEWHVERVAGIRPGNVIVFALPEHERMVVVAETTASQATAGTIAETVLARLREQLARAPHEVVLIRPGTLPKTTSGKRQRDLCRSRYRTGELAVVATAGKPPWGGQR